MIALAMLFVIQRRDACVPNLMWATIVAIRVNLRTAVPMLSVCWPMARLSVYVAKASLEVQICLEVAMILMNVKPTRVPQMLFVRILPEVTCVSAHQVPRVILIAKDVPPHELHLHVLTRIPALLVNLVWLTAIQELVFVSVAKVMKEIQELDSAKILTNVQLPAPSLLVVLMHCARTYPVVMNAVVHQASMAIPSLCVKNVILQNVSVNPRSNW